MKKFTFILTSMLFLLVGGVFSQEVTTLYLNRGQSWSATNGTNNWDNNSGSSVTYTAGDVTFNQTGINEGSTGLTGSNWVADEYHEGETHIFTVTLSEAPGSDNFSIYVGSPDWNFGQIGNGYEKHVVIPAGKTTASISISKAYKEVYIFQTKGSNATLKIASITRTITTAPFVALNESSNNLISSNNNVVVELTRSFVKDTWNTVCLPFALTSAQATQLFGSGYKLAQFTGVSGTTMQFTTTDSFVAGVPYLVKPTIDVSNASPVVLVDVNITAKDPTPVKRGNYTFTGTFTTRTFSGDECNTSRFVATGNELKKPIDNTTLKSLRCYFTVSATAPARSLSFDVDEEGGTTSINTVQGSGVMVNGYYNLAGQRVAQPTKGLYIVNGKKVVIK